MQRLLARGGMGTLYFASDSRTFGRKVVIKTLPDSPVDPTTQDAKSRLCAEARRLAALRHPTIPRIVSYLWEAGQSYLVMEHIEGRDLLQMLTRTDDETGASIAGQPYDLAEVLRWGIAVCEVLEYLASRRPHPVIHGDIKPANLMLDQDNQAIYLVDFGATVGCEPVVASHTKRPTRPFGTPGYAPPEQYCGEVKASSDVYTLAATLYHLATDDDPSLHPFDFPQLAQLGELGDVLRMALQSQPEQRPNATAFRRHLTALLGAGDPLALMAPDGASVADELGLVVWCEQHWDAAISWLYSGLPGQVARWRGPARGEELRATLQRHADRAAGLDAALALLDPQGFGAARPQLRASARLIECVSQATRPSDTPLTFFNSGRRYIQAKLVLPSWLAASQTELVLTPDQHATISLSADVRQLARCGRVSSAILVETPTATLLRIEARASAPHHAHVTECLLQAGISIALMSILALLLIGIWRYWPSTRLAVIATPATPALPSTSVAFQQPQEFVDRTLECYQRYIKASSVAFSPDRTLFAGSNHRGDRVTIWDVADGNVRRTITGFTSAVTSLAFSSDGKVLAVGADQGEVTLWRIADGALLHCGKTFSRIFDLAFRPDGRALASSEPMVAPIQFWQITDRLYPNRMLRSDAEINLLTYSPDGKMLAASGRQGGSIWLWRLEDRKMLWSAKRNGECVSLIEFSPDGKTIATLTENNLALWAVATGKLLWEQHLRQFPGPGLAFNPDGTIIATKSGFAVDLWRTADGTPLRTIYGLSEGNGIAAIAFRPDGRLIVALPNADRNTFKYAKP